MNKSNGSNRGSLVKSLTKNLARMTFLCIFLLLVLAMVISIGAGLWLHTWNAFTEEKLVAKVKIGELQEDSDGNPYFKATYTPVDNPSALSKFFLGEGATSDNSEMTAEQEQYYLNGDRLMVESEVIIFDNWATWLGFDTVYKMTRIRGEYTDLEKERNAERSIYDLNGGIDPVWETLEYNQESMDFLVNSVYGSSASQSARRSEKEWGLYMTEDGLIIKSLD